MTRIVMSLIDIDREKLEKTILYAVFSLVKSEAQRADIRKVVNQLLRGEIISDSIIKQMVETIFVYPDTHCELKLRGKDNVWTFERTNQQRTT